MPLLFLLFVSFHGPRMPMVWLSEFEGRFLVLLSLSNSVVWRDVCGGHVSLATQSIVMMSGLNYTTVLKTIKKTKRTERV